MALMLQNANTQFRTVSTQNHTLPFLSGRGAKHRVLTGAQALKKFQARQAAYAKDTAHQNAQQAQQVAHGKHHKMLALAHDVVRRLKYILEEVAHSCQGVAAALRLRVDLFRSVHAADYLLAVHFAHIGMAGNDCIALNIGPVALFIRVDGVGGHKINGGNQAGALCIVQPHAVVGSLAAGRVPATPICALST